LLLLENATVLFGLYRRFIDGSVDVTVD